MQDATKTLSILLVEDSSLDGRLLLEALKPAMTAGEVVVQTVKRLAAAQQELQRYNFSCVLLDLGLPDGHGVENVRLLREVEPNTAVIVLTGLNDEATAQEAMQLGAQDYLIKGETDGKRLMKLIRHAVERNRQSRLLEASRDNALQAATHDTLTLLPNTALFLDRVRVQLAQARSHGALMGLAVLRMTGVDDARLRYGPLVANELLQRLTQVMSELLQPTDTLARVGPADFALLRPSLLDGMEELQQLVQHCARRVEGQTLIGDCIVAPQLHAGFSRWNSETDTADDLLERATAAARRVLALPAAVVAAATESAVAQQQPALASDVQWQPWLDAETRRCMGVLLVADAAEAAPGSGALEEPAAVVERLQVLVWQARAWHEFGFEVPMLACKLPAHCLRMAGFAAQLIAIARSAGVSSSRLLLQIGEAAFKDYDAHSAEINQLRLSGFRLGMDGDGSASISLADFSRCPLDVYWLSKAFVRTLMAENLQGPTRRFATAVLGAAQSLGAVVIASGVDSEDSEQALRLVGVRYMLGKGLVLPAGADQLPDIWQLYNDIHR